MKRQIYLIICMAMTATFMACDIRHDDNGDLGGMWQLTLWTDAQGDSVATNENAIYYHFQLQLMKVERLDNHGTGEYHLRFTHQPDSLIIREVYARPDDSRVEISKLKNYGIPQDGRFHIDALTDDRMQLSSPEGTLRFRKY